jgi:hypothetical protein
VEHQFTLRLNRELTEAEVEALYEAGLADAGIETGPEGSLVDVTRDAATRDEAVASATADVAKVPGLRVTEVL